MAIVHRYFTHWDIISYVYIRESFKINYCFTCVLYLPYNGILESHIMSNLHNFLDINSDRIICWPKVHLEVYITC